MIRLHETIEVPRPIGEVFAYTADFGNIAQWDPGVADVAQERPRSRCTSAQRSICG